MCSKNIKILIRHFNYGTVEKCLDSLLQQTYKHFEVYIFNPRADYSLKRLLDYSEKDSRINIIRVTGLKINNDLMIFNKGQELSKDNWLIFLDEKTVFSDNNSLARISEHMDSKYNLITWKDKLTQFCFNTTDISKPVWAEKDTLDLVYNKLVSSDYFKNIYSLENICYELDIDKPINSDAWKEDTLINPIHNENNFFNNYLSGIKEIPIYYINLDRSPERNNYTLENIEQTNTKLEDLQLISTRITAVDGKNPENVYNLFTRNDIVPFEISNYEVACCSSHLFAIKKAYDNNDNFAIIIEDDVNLQLFHKNFDFFSKKTKLLSDSIEIIQLLPFKAGFYGKSLYEIEIGFYEWKNMYYCAGLYLITRNGMEKIVNRYFANGKLKAEYINCYIADELLFCSCKTITSNIPLALLTITKSTIRDRDDTNIIKHDIVKSYNMSQKINS